MDSQAKPSRFSTLNVFGKFSSKPPRPPPKDQWYRMGSKSTVSLAPSHALSTHAASIASSSHDTLQLPQTPLSMASRSQYDLSRTMSPALSTRTTATTTTSGAQSRMSETSSFRRGFSKLSSSFGKRPKLPSRSSTLNTTLHSDDSMRMSEDGVLVDNPDDDSVSAPWNFQHHLHVDEGLSNLPPEWIDQLRASGLKDADIMSTHSRRNRTTYLQNHPDVSLDTFRSRSPYSPSVSSSSPSSLSPSPLPTSTPPACSTVPRRLVRADSKDDASSTSTDMRSYSSGSKISSGSPPSSYDHASRPSLSSVYSRSPSALPSPATSVYDEDPGTATAAFFTATERPARPDRPLPRAESPYGNSISHPSTPSRRATTFRVTNGSPPASPPPAYGQSEPPRADVQAYADVKVNSSSGPSGRASRDGSRSSSSELRGERRSEETLTPEVLLRSEESDSRSSGHPAQTDYFPTPPNAPPTSSPPFRLNLSMPSQGLSPSPPVSPIPRTTVLPPRLSLHQDIDSDLSSWSEHLFSVMNTPDTALFSISEQPSPSSSSAAARTREPVKARPTTPKKSPVPPPLVLSSPSGISDVMIDADADIDTEKVVQQETTPLFDEVMALVQSPSAIDVSSPSPPSSLCTLSASSSPQANYDFLKHNDGTSRNSDISQLSSRDSQMTVSTSSRWSRATAVRDVRDATIVHVRKTSVANAMTIPAPCKHSQQPSSSSSMILEEGSNRPTTSSSTSALVKANDATFPLASDFPMPPPSPGDANFSNGSLQGSPLLTSFPNGPAIASVDEVALPGGSDSNSAVSTPINRFISRLPSPASTRSSQSSSGSGSSSSSSQINPMSVVSGSDECPDKLNRMSRLSSAVCVELSYESDCSLLSPTESEAGSSKWVKEQAKHIDITTSVYSNGEAPNDLCYDKGDGALAVVDWLTDTPSPHFELHGAIKGDSPMFYNHQRESRLLPGAVDRPAQVRRPSLQINGISTVGINNESQKYLTPSSASFSSSSSPSPSSEGTSPSPSPLQRYRGWVSEVVAPLEEFIDHNVDPRDLFTDMEEIAEGESGSVYVATVVVRPKRPSGTVKKQDVMADEDGATVAIKNVPLLPEGSTKLNDLRRELLLMWRVRQENILSMDGLYVDLTEDSLWIKMELMERSLADMLALADEGLVLGEKTIARFSSDILNALAHLESLGIVHRDVRSDNLLVNSQGVLKIADFSHALLVDSASPIYTDYAGVVYWQAPEMRSGSYDARKVDVWSAGATAWEMAETVPPFMDIEDPRELPDRWPALSQSETYTPSFHDFLSFCSSPPSSRPTAYDLLTTPFIHSACARSLVVELLTQCKSIEGRIHRRQSIDSQGTILS